MSRATEFDTDLVERARGGDVMAYGLLVAATERLVRSVVGREITDPGLRDDAVQETYLRAFRRLPDLADPQAFPAWLGRVAVTTARNELRRRRWVFLDAPALAELPAVASVADDDACEGLRRAMIALSTDDRRLVERYYLGRWTTARLAETEGISPAAVRKRLQRARDRLREDIEMNAGTETNLPDRIVALLSRPILADLPENPVGAVWETIRGTLGDMDVIELPEMIPVPDVALVCGEGAADGPGVHRVDDGRILRFDLTVPMILAARGRGVPTALAAVGKAYRDHPEDHAHLKAFHQAELFWTASGGNAWSPMERIEAILDAVLPNVPLRVERADYPLYADRGYEVSVHVADHWVEIGGFARFAPRIVHALGEDPGATMALGVGLGLERLASLAYGIEDVRHVSESRVDAHCGGPSGYC